MGGNVDIDKLLAVDAGSCSDEELRKKLAGYINTMLNEDFSSLVQLLYSIDVSENRLKQLLSEHPDTDAALIITDLIIERQKQKFHARQKYKSSGDIPEDEKW